MAIRRNLALRGLALVTILSLAWGCTFPSGEQADEQAAPAQDILIEPAGSSPETPSTLAMATEAHPPAVDGSAPTGEEPAPTSAPPSGPEDMILYPAESVAYEKYLDVIRGRPGLADTAVIEATITSILKSEICPYQEEVCRIEPYPDDWGTVRVDKIVEYAPPGEPGNNPVEAQASGTPAGTMSGSEVQTSPQYMGAGVQAGPAKYEPLQAGQEVQAHFLLTARPARVRHLTGTAYEGAEAAQSSGVDAGQVAVHQGEPGELTFEPIPREGDYFLFSTLATDAGDSGELVLPGLDAGSRFRARVQYDGTLYVQEYKVIP